MVTIRPIAEVDIPACVNILRALPDWFGIESAIVDYGQDLQTLDGLVAIENESIVGFSGHKRYGDASVEINVIGVHPDFRGQGIGTRLLEVLEASLSDEVRLLHMKTLAPSHSDPNYAQTRAFWQAKGFIPMDAHEMWGPENPCLVMVKPRSHPLAG